MATDDATAPVGSASERRAANAGRTRARRVGSVGYSLPLLIATLLTLAALWPRADFVLDVGAPGDQLFLANAHGDERVAEYSYRWTGKNDEPLLLTAPGLGAVRRLRLVVRAQALPERGPVAVRILAGGRQVGALVVDGAMAERAADIALPGDGAAGGDLVLAFDAPTSKVPGDQRPLGVKVDAARISPLGRDGGLFWRTLWWHLAGCVALAGALLLLIGKGAGRAAQAGRYGAALAVPLAAAAALPWALAALPAALWLAALALAVRWRAGLLVRLVRAWAALDRPRVADWVAAAGIALYAAVVLPHLLAVPWINHADYADNAVVARNLVRGNGFSVDYVAQFYRDWPAVRHPADTWPPLQPLMIATAFALFGVSTGVAKLPNLLVFLGLLWLVYRAGRATWSPRAGLLAALLVAANPDLLDGVLYPLNDVAFTLLAFAYLLLLWKLTERGARSPARGGTGNGRGPGTSAGASSFRALPLAAGLRVARPWLLLGLLAGLLVLCKPSGALILAGGGLWALWAGWRRGALRATLIGGGIAAVVAGLVWLPWCIRNQITFGQPFYSTESFDAWILGFRDWENIYRVYGGALPLPHRSLLVGYGLDAVGGKIALQFRKAWQDLAGGAIVVAPLLPLIVLGGVATADRGRRALLGLLGVSVGLYALFVLTYWHYERRYALFLIPWAALLGAAGLHWLHDRLAEARGRATGVLLALVALAVILWPQVGGLRDEWSSSLRRPNPLIVAEWVRDNTPPDAVVMTRNPWELSFHGERLSVMIPFDDLTTILATGDRYGVTYLQLDHLNERGTRRPALDPLYDGPDEWHGFRKVFDRRDEDGEGLLVYSFPQGAAKTGALRR